MMVNCMKCGATWTTVVESLGHPCFGPGNDLDTWAQTAKDLGLRTVNLPDSDGKIVELVIFKSGDLDRGWLWIKAYRLVGKGELNKGIVCGDLLPEEAFALIGVLARRDGTGE